MFQPKHHSWNQTFHQQIKNSNKILSNSQQQFNSWSEVYPADTLTQSVGLRKVWVWDVVDVSLGWRCWELEISNKWRQTVKIPFFIVYLCSVFYRVEHTCTTSQNISIWPDFSSTRIPQTWWWRKSLCIVSPCRLRRPVDHPLATAKNSSCGTNTV